MIHSTKDIPTAGDEIEISVRNFFKEMLPEKYNIGQGHLVDCKGITSPQLDIIIADNNNIPTLFTTHNGTKYIPIDSVYAVGEIKSSYCKSKNYIQRFSEVITDIKNNLYHEEIVNTCYGGIEGKTDFIMRDIFFDTSVKILNRLFYFMIFVEGNDFAFKDIVELYRKTDIKYLPNVVVILNKGIIIRGAYTDKGFAFNKYPEETNSSEYDWFFYPLISSGNGTPEGNCLAMLYYCIVEHLSKSYLEPPSLTKYMKDILFGSRKLMQKAGDLSS